MRILFFKGKGFISRVIQLQTRSQYSHVGIVVGNRFYESWHAGGVQADRSIIGEDYDSFRVSHYKVNEDAIDNIKEFLQMKLGFKYDFISVARFVSRRPAKENNKYFCAELIMDAFKYAGIHLLHAESHNVSPRDLAMSPFLFKVI